MNAVEENYRIQLGLMAENAKLWKQRNPDKKVLVQFNFPRSVCLACIISLAIERHYVSTNAEGVELIQALWPWGVSTEPTVLMVRGALEAQP